MVQDYSLPVTVPLDIGHRRLVIFRTYLKNRILVQERGSNKDIGPKDIGVNTRSNITAKSKPKSIRIDK